MLPVGFVDGVNDEHDWSGGAEEERDDRNDANVAVRTFEGQIENDESYAAILEKKIDLFVYYQSIDVHRWSLRSVFN
jgi:hypothetical protein